MRTAERNYLVETKADRDIDSPNVAVKAQAAVAWCDQGSTVSPSKELHQSQDWEYLILSESLFKTNRGLSFEALIPLCRGLRDRIIAQAKSKLFLI